MSVSLFRWTDECEQDPQCVGDCDLCRKETMIDKYDEVGIPTEIEADGFITRPEQLERVSQSKAKPMSGCIYPECEECDKYHGHYCTVPMVVSKQMWKNLDGLLGMHHMQIENLKYEMARLVAFVERTSCEPADKRAEPQDHENELNFTWDDYLGEDK